MSSIKSLTASIIGNVAQWYNYTVITALVPLFLILFLPEGSPFSAALLFFLLYSAPLLTRPLGGLCLGNYADAFGRKAAIVLTVSLMAVSMLILALTPSYGQSGFVAPAILVLILLVHGFASGGEFPTIATFIAETSPPTKKIFHGSWVFFGIFSGMVLSQALLMTVALNFSPPHFASFGWRILIGIGGLLGVLGFFVRNQMKETPDFLKIEKKRDILHSDLLKNLKKSRKQLLLAFCLGIFDGCIFNLYLTTAFWINPNHSPARLSIFHLITLLCALTTCLLFGKIAQKIGGLKTQMIATILLLVLIYPLSSHLFSGGQDAALLASLIFGLLATLYLAPMPGVLASLFPPEIRSTCIAISYSVAIALSGCAGFLLLRHFFVEEQFAKISGIYVGICGVIALSSLLLLQKQKQKA